ncbi:Leucine-rich repeat-containing protein 38 [Myotis davidii]|uniref:Leucine-rich repeat-containing protein 38 n=1 Tax=Myotis davidii TaxID=225400 RepID=L5LPN1_MYODS|nr:Leucine-rich repeat-containing protein 38 [Myotis davidii]
MVDTKEVDMEEVVDIMVNMDEVGIMVEMVDTGEGMEPTTQACDLTGLDEIQCSLPPENRRVFLRQLSEASFSECRFSLSLTDLFIIIFSGVAVSIAAIISSFFLATVVQCFQRCTPNKDTEEEDEDEDD